MINLQCRIFTSEIDIIEWDWNKFQPHLFINNYYNSCTSVSIWVSPFPKKFKVSNTRAFSLTPWNYISININILHALYITWYLSVTFLQFIGCKSSNIYYLQSQQCLSRILDPNTKGWLVSQPKQSHLGWAAAGEGLPSSWTVMATVEQQATLTLLPVIM